ncbi:MAG: peptide-methionine (S)-S-oxide reductase [Bacteroidetes bacterium]|nr:MAG: peptide-methionine (S)-S-oxide reductase [Bacteroidota bacterium]
MKSKINIFTLIFVLIFISCKGVNGSSQESVNENNELLNVNKSRQNKENNNSKMNTNNNREIAVFGAGCFWCVEAVFQELNGVHSVESGYTGGTVKKPTYNDICTGETGHAEVAKIVYDADVVSFELLLSVFFKTHNPTTLNSQGADRGTQYRSAIFYTSEKQKEIAQGIINELNKEKVYPNPIVTEVTELGIYYEAEDYHQDYYKNNPNQGYCTFVIQPKIEKFRKVFKENLKDHGNK